MSNRINHDGIIDSISDNTIRVRIVQTSACAACGLAKHCNSSESKEKIVDVKDDASGYAVGDHVMVSVSAAMGYRAVMLGFGLPFLLLVAVVVMADVMMGNEPLAALLGLSALVPYYVALYMNRGRIGRSLSVEIAKVEKQTNK